MGLSMEEVQKQHESTKKLYERGLTVAPVDVKRVLDLYDTIEALQAENEQLQKEKDAAIADMQYLVLIWGGGCSVCKRWNKANPKLPWCNKNYTCEFEWRGLEEGSI